MGPNMDIDGINYSKPTTIIHIVLDIEFCVKSDCKQV